MFKPARPAPSAAGETAKDTDLTMELLRGGWRVVYAEQARAWTDRC
jgi:cellulose synthase/poly-beta-1,6-N-acetylglucosamine synthase-like glycosyltransferase